jgi:hypothetical protein
MTLEELCLSGNTIGNDGAVALADSLVANTSLRVLYCPCTALGAQSFGRMLCINTTLIELSLSDYTIGDVGAVALAHGLMENTSLKLLCLVHSHIGNRGAIALGDALKSNASLESLNLAGNIQMELQGFEALLNGLARNTCLLRLNLAFTDLPTHLQDKINDHLAANRYWKDHGKEISPRLLPLIFPRVASHPAVLYLFVREHIPPLVASGGYREQRQHTQAQAQKQAQNVQQQQPRRCWFGFWRVFDCLRK